MIKRVDSLDELDLALKIRREVFVKEQGIPEALEFDEFDNLKASVLHILLLQGDKAIGAGRLHFIDDIEAKLCRVCILESYRGKGYGSSIMIELEAFAKDMKILKIKLHAQIHAVNFYEKKGYVRASDAFIEDGLEHVLMIKELTPY